MRDFLHQWRRNRQRNMPDIELRVAIFERAREMKAVMKTNKAASNYLYCARLISGLRNRPSVALRPVIRAI